MKFIENINLEKVREVYNGAEGDLWELIMGEQIHVGGLVSSMDLAEKADIGEDMTGLDLCCCNGAGMRFLIHFRKVKAMTGVDATEKVVERGRERCGTENLSDRTDFILADASNCGLDSESYDFIWGEDAWCYVEDKEQLISEASRMVKKGGTIAFTDWIEGDNPMSDDEAERFLSFMKFPNINNLQNYSELLEKNSCQIIHAENTGRFSPYIDLYLDMLNKQLTYDALKVIGFNAELMQELAGEMVFMQELAKQNKIAQGLFVAKKQ